MQYHEVIIVGAGFAGASTAWALTELGVSDVLVLDQGPVSGIHSSGRNAGMVRQATEDPALAAMTREGATVIRSLEVPFRETGSYLIGGATRIPESVRAIARHSLAQREEVIERVPLLVNAELPDVLSTPSDGIVEVHALLEHYLTTSRDNGATIRFGVSARGPRIENGQLQGIETDHGPFACQHLVIAAGAWASKWGEQAEIPITFEPRRRHLIAATHPTDTRDWPWVWNMIEGYYFRPEAAGLLWSACDSHIDEPGEAVADPAAAEQLASKLARVLPAAQGVQPINSWAGHRTFAPDERFVLGPDPRLQGWHWAAGLGGHGVTASAAIGRRVAAGITGSRPIEPHFLPRESVFAERVTG